MITEQDLFKIQKGERMIFTREIKQILQALSLLDLIKNTKIDMSERERGLLNLLLKQSEEIKR